MAVGSKNLYSHATVQKFGIRLGKFGIYLICIYLIIFNVIVAKFVETAKKRWESANIQII